jgi:hypothetical protein
MESSELLHRLLKFIKTTIQGVLDTGKVNGYVFMGIVDLIHRGSQKFG